MYNVTITAGMTSSSFDVDIIDNMIKDGDKMFTITIRLISTCLPVTIDSDTTTVTITDEGSKVVVAMYSVNCVSIISFLFSIQNSFCIKNF